MAVNYAETYSPMVDERFKLAALTGGAVDNTGVDWTGVKTVTIYSIPTASMNNYVRNGANRYGTPSELDNNVQAMTITKDRSFTFTIDRMNKEETQMVMDSGAALSRQIDEVIIPELDIYRLAALEAGAGNTSAPTPITAANAYSSFLDGDVALTNEKAPQSGRIAFVSPTFYKFIKLDSAFVKQSDISQQMMITGAVGMVDNTSIIRVPQSYLPADTEFIITHAVAMASPVKLADYKIHDNPPGINGWLVEGRVVYDAFIRNMKKGTVYVHKSA